MPKYFYETMSHREVKQYIRDGFTKLGLIFPEDNYWWDRTSFRPTRGDIVAMMVYKILQDPDAPGSKQSLDTLIIWAHPDRAERKAAAARQGYLWCDEHDGPINDHEHALTADLIQAGNPAGRKRLH